MDPLESRINAAIRAAAEEVRPEDIPPLRLRTRRRGLRLRAGAVIFGSFSRTFDMPPEQPGRVRVTRSPGSARHWLAPLAAATSLAAVVACLVVLGRATGTGSDGPYPRSAAVTTAQKQLANQALDAYFPATGAQYTSGLAFAWTRQRILGSRAGACLTQAGLPPQSFPKSKRQYQLSFPDNSQFPDLVQRSRTHEMAPAGGDVRADRARPWAHGPQHPDVSASSCMTQYTHSLWRLDKIADPLAGAWLRKVSSIQASPAVRAKRAGFVSCLESFGVPAEFANARGTAGHRLFTGFFAWMNWIGASNGSPQRYSNQQRLWTPVFVRCAAPTVMTMERLQTAARSKFLDAHAKQIATIRRIVIGIAPPRSL